MSKITPQICFPKTMSRNYWPKLLSNFFVPKLRFFKPPKIILQRGSRKLLPKNVAEIYSPKLSIKINSQSYFPKLRFFKVVVQICYSKLPYIIIPQNYTSPNLFRKIISQTHSPKWLSKVAPNNCSPELLKLPRKLFLKKTLIYFSKIIPRNYLSKYIFINIIIKLQSYTS